MARLVDKLPLNTKRDEILDECTRLLDQEVKSKGGLSGMAIKTGYKLLKGFSPNAVKSAIDDLLDEFIDALEPLHKEFQDNDGGSSFGSFLKSNASRAAESLVQVTDARARGTQHKALASAYNKLRPGAVRHVEQAIPRLGDLIDKFYES